MKFTFRVSENNKVESTNAKDLHKYILDDAFFKVLSAVFKGDIMKEMKFKVLYTILPVGEKMIVGEVFVVRTENQGIKVWSEIHGYLTIETGDVLFTSHDEAEKELTETEEEDEEDDLLDSLIKNLGLDPDKFFTEQKKYFQEEKEKIEKQIEDLKLQKEVLDELIEFAESKAEK